MWDSRGYYGRQQNNLIANRLPCPQQSRRQSLVEVFLATALFYGVLTLVQTLITLSGMEWGRQHIEMEIGLQGATALLIITAVTWMGRSRWADLGFRSGRRRADILWGMAAIIPVYGATVVFSIFLALVVNLLGLQTLEEMATGKIPMVETVSQFAPVTIIPLMVWVGFYEEVAFRGFLMGRLYNIFGRVWAAVVISAAVFGLAHAPTQGWMGAVQTGFLGVLMALLVFWRRSIWPAMVCHVGINLIGVSLIFLLKYLEIMYPGLPISH